VTSCDSQEILKELDYDYLFYFGDEQYVSRDLVDFFVLFDCRKEIADSFCFSSLDIVSLENFQKKIQEFEKKSFELSKNVFLWEISFLFLLLLLL
jgi:hypothetical protein